MLFSFLVPVYNVEKYLARCIDSLLIQKGVDFEILLLDDGSTDSSGAICDRYAAQHPGVVRVIHKENEGLLLTRRRGFREASGDWFICVDSDDYVSPELLETVVQTIAAHDGCDMVMFNYQYVDDRNSFSPSRLKLTDGSMFSGPEKQKLFALRMTGTSVNMMWMRAVKREIVDIDADYSACGLRNMCEDAVQVLPLYTNSKKTVFIDKPLYCYRKGGSAITSRTTWEHWQAIHRSFVLEQPYAELWNVPEEVSRRRYTKQLENICNCVRWLYANETQENIPGLLRTMKQESMFRECLAQLDTKYASSRYSALCMPILAKMVDKERYGSLKRYFRLENRLRRKGN